MLQRISSSFVFSFVFLLLVSAASSVTAQASRGTLLTGADVTEKNLVDALTPERSDDAEPVVQTRGIRASLRPSVGENTSRPKKVASASLLITFDTNSTLLNARSKQDLDVVAKALNNEKLSTFNFEVEGHADPRGTSEANRVLSRLRAEAARDYLINTHGISGSRLHATGKGDIDPMNTRNLAAAENRRVAIITIAP